MSKKPKSSAGVKKATDKLMSYGESPRSPYAPKPRRIPIKVKRK